MEGAEQRGGRATQAPNRWEWSREEAATRLSILCRGGDPPIQNRPSSVCLRAACAHHDGRAAFQFHIPYPPCLYTYTRAIHLSSFSPLSLFVYISALKYTRLCIYVYIYMYVYIYGRMAWVERDGNASDEIRGTRVPRVTQGQLDSRPFKRDYVQRPSSLAPSLSISGFSLFSRARGEQRSVFPILPGFRWMDSVLFLLLRAVVFDGIFFFGKGVMVVFFKYIY